MRLGALAFSATIALALVGPACSSSGDDGPTLTVFAAASLTDAFEDLAESFEQQHPGVSVRLSFASSTALATQVREGAPADILASADPVVLEQLHVEGRTGRPAAFATNALAVAVSARDDAIETFADIARPGLRLVLAAEGVPLGDYSREVLERASLGSFGPGFANDVLANVRSDEPNARATLAKVELGEADAAIVYLTDIASAGGAVREVPIPPGYNVTTNYAAAAVTAAGEPRLAAEFIAFLGSAEGRAILLRRGLAAPRVAAP